MEDKGSMHAKCNESSILKVAGKFGQRGDFKDFQKCIKML